MKLRQLPFPAALLTLALLAGCGSGPQVQAVAPAPHDDLAGITPEAGQYTVFRATGFEQNYHPSVERVWSVQLNRGERVGFKWVTEPALKWAPQGGFHLVAFAGDQTYDLGSFEQRDLKYVWAGANADVKGYFDHQAQQSATKALTMQ